MNPTQLNPNSQVDVQKPKKDYNNKNLAENIQLAFLDICKSIDDEDSEIRKQQIRIWKKYEKFFHGIQYIFWSESSQDWLAPIDTRYNNSGTDSNRDGSEGVFYDYVINVYRGHGESIIAALAAQLPAVRFPPDDADDEDDRLTANTFNKISDLLDRHWQSKLIIFAALLTAWNQGLFCAYHYNKSDKKYGMLKLPIYGEETSCPECGYIASDSEEIDCANCVQNTGESLGLAPTPTQLVTNIVLKGFDETLPKSRTVVEITGPLFVKVPIYAKDQDQFGYVAYAVDQPISLLKNVFCYDSKTKQYDEELADKIDATAGQFDLFERVGRTPSQFTYVNAYPDNSLGTVRRYWIRPFEYERLSKAKIEEKKYIYANYSNGAYVCFVGNDLYLESREEELDKHWTISKIGLSTFIHSDPMGQPLIPGQEMKNQLTNLTMETIDQSIPDIYADPEVINFEAFSEQEKRPGSTYPAQPKVGQRLSDAFYEGPKAQLSKDVMAFEAQNQQDNEFVVASFPSIYGGPQEASSRTASEYNMSRQMALQRLSITWSYLSIWWSKLKEKCVRLYVENVVDDEKYATKDDQGNYVNVWIRKADLLGKVGEVEPEASETFPTTMAQKQTMLMQAIQMGNEVVNAAILNPENAKVIFDAMGFPELKLPDDNQRIKQVRENQFMIAMGTMVPIEPLIDDDTMHITTAKNFLVSYEGQDLKNTNPQAYQMIMAHIQMHQNNLAQIQAVQNQQQMQQQATKVTGKLPGPPAKPNNTPATPSGQPQGKETVQ